jgi:hypothetical protein
MEIPLLLFGKEREIGFDHLVPRPRNYSEQLTRVVFLKGTVHPGVQACTHFHLTPSMYSMVQKNLNNLKATYQSCGNYVRLFGPNFGKLGTKRKVGRKKKEQ